MKKNLSDDAQLLVPALAQTMQFALQGVRQSTALAAVLMKKGVVTKTELDEAMKSTADLSKKLTDMLSAFEPPETKAN